jgi:pullulanase
MLFALHTPKNVDSFLKSMFVACGFIVLFACETPVPVKIPFEAYPVYEGDDLGIRFSDDTIHAKVWSPSAEDLQINIYPDDAAGDRTSEHKLIKGADGVWAISLPQSYSGQYYTFQARHDGKWGDEVPGPDAKAVGTNGKRGQLIDPSMQNPSGWEQDTSPELKSARDIVLYELHIRDFSIHPESGHTHKGKYLAFTERGTKTPAGIATGVDHLVEMGVTHVHLLPAFDFLSVDESKPDVPQFNWGYDPQNYNVPEGSYSTNPADGAVRIREFKAMVKALHDAGLRVVMDVVYNHTGRTEGLSFDALVPGYYYRQWEDGTYSNASGCGNEVASDRPMVRKFMIESLKYWVEEYHIDGFRFDLMAIHDLETMRQIEKELDAIKPDIFLYGEGWMADKSPLPEKDQSLKKYTFKIPAIAAFSDDLRDGIKGHWSEHTSKGFASGNSDLRESVKFGIVGAIDHPGISYAYVNNSDSAWALEPVQCIGYVSCHDNHTLYDKLQIANPGAEEEEIIKMHILSNSIVLTSQAVPFLHAGVEFLRTKQGVENSYQSPDSINQIDWSLKSTHSDVLESYKALISMRKAHPGFRMGSADLVREKLRFLDTGDHLVAYQISAPAEDSWESIFVVFNGSPEPSPVDLPGGTWLMAWSGSAPYSGASSQSGKAVVPGYGMLVLYQPRLD